MCVDNAYLRSVLEQLRKVLCTQLGYHDVNARRCDAMERRLRRFGTFLFTTSLVACLLHLVSEIVSIHISDLILRWLTFVGAFFPALGASLAGIANQGEFRRIARRSEAMRDKFKEMLPKVVELEARTSAGSTVGQLSGEVSAVSAEAGHLMINAVLDWRVVFLDRPLEPPS